MCSFFCEHFCPEAFPYFNRKFIKRRYGGDEGDTGRSGNSEVELFSNPVIRNISYPMRQAGRTFYVRFCLRRVRTQESFGQWLRDECARSNSRLEIAFRMKSRESDVYSETRHSQICRQIARGWESGRVVVESCRTQLIANLAIKLFMKRFIPGAVEPNHFKSHD